MNSSDVADNSVTAQKTAGRKGGRTTSQRYGTEFFAAIGRAGGRLGGQTTLARYGTEHFRRMAKISGERRTERARQRRSAAIIDPSGAAGPTKTDTDTVGR